MDAKRLVIVNPSAVSRVRLAAWLAEGHEVSVVAAVATVDEALELPDPPPDAVLLGADETLDVGIRTVLRIRSRLPGARILILDRSAASAKVRALRTLSKRAGDFVQLPPDFETNRETRDRVFCELLAKVGGDKAATSCLVTARELPGVLAVGASTGGPKALEAFLSGLPHEYPLPIVIVQHMPPVFTKSLADRLSARTGIRIAEAETGGRLEPGRGWMAAGGFHMFVDRDRCGVFIGQNQDPPEHSCRPSVDVLFRSVAKTFGAKTVAVVLTGMGYDGRSGCEEVRGAGGRVVVQDEETSVVWGMPGAVAQAGLAERVLPLPQLAGAAVELTGTLMYPGAGALAARVGGIQ